MAAAVSVQLVPLRRLAPVTALLCEALRREAGRCWSELVALHVASRGGKWLTERELKALSKGGRFRLHSQSVQALAEKLIANVDTARTNRTQEQEAGAEPTTRFPYREKPYQTVTWKGQAVRVEGERLVLPNGRTQADLVLPLPARFHGADIRQVELLWRADHYQMALTIAEPPPKPDEQPAPDERAAGQVAGVDLGEVNLAAVCTQDGQALVVNGRLLRHLKQLRNKRHAAYAERQARCKKGSRRWKQLQRQKSRTSAKLYRQQRNILHQASRKVIDFAEAHSVNELAIGDVRDIADGVAKGRHANQKISQWPHGQFRRYLKEKGERRGMRSTLTGEAYSTRTCSCCGHCHPSAPRGRVFRCSGCGTTIHRDANGAANICSKQVYGRYAAVQVKHTMHRQAAAVRVPTRAKVAGSKRAVSPPGDGTPPEASPFTGR
ncbi:MAG: transposase [Chloroflexales bacterium]|nr:transposase [Chloroflexales bacterium]